MNHKLGILTVFHLVAMLILGSCGSPTISDYIDMQAVISPEMSQDHGFTDVYMIGGDGAERAHKIIYFPDGSYMVFGVTIKSFGESTDILAVKVSPEHKVLWARTYGGPHKDLLVEVIPASDGGYLMAGESQSLFFTFLPGNRQARPVVAKISGTGDRQWACSVGGFGGDPGLIQTMDGNCVLAGYIQQSRGYSSPKYCSAIVKLDNEGNPVWAQGYESESNNVSRIIREMPDGSLLVVGYSLGGGADHLYVMMTDPLGVPLHCRAYSCSRSLYPMSSLLLENGDLLISGYVENSEIDLDVIAMRIAPSGDLIWAKVYDSLEKTMPISIAAGASDEYIIAGTTGYVSKVEMDGFALLIDGDGDLTKSSLIGGMQNDDLRSACMLNGGKYALLLSTASFGTTYANYLVAQWDPSAALDDSVFTESVLTVKTSDYKLTEFTPDYKIRALGDNLDMKVLKTEREEK